MTVTVSTFNPGAGETGQLPDLFRRLGETSDVVALQEAERWRHPFTAITGHTLVPGYVKTPIFYNPATVDLVGYASVKLSDATRVGRAGAGPSTLIEKWANAVRVRERATGRRTWVLNWHAAPSIHLEVRDELHERQVRELAAYAGFLPGRSVIVGDFNAEWGHPNLLPFRDLGYRLLNPPGATHKRRRVIDLVLGSPRVRVTGGTITPGPDDDDHNAVTVELDLDN